MKLYYWINRLRVLAYYHFVTDNPGFLCLLARWGSNHCFCLIEDFNSQIGCKSHLIHTLDEKLVNERLNFRKARLRRTYTVFNVGLEIINLVQQYKYLGILLDEHLKFDSCDTVFAKSRGRALAPLISKYNINKNFNHNIYTLY